MGSSGYWARRPHAVPAIVAGAMLVVGVADWPYGYYQFLRWITCAAAVFVAWQAFAWHRQWAVWAFAFVGLLFNPIVPVHLNRDIWRVLDLGAAAFFATSIHVLVNSQRAAREEKGEGDV